MQNKNITIYIVNLKKDTQKKKHMQDLCSKFGLDVEFVEAVYGKEMSLDYIDEVYVKDLAIQEMGRELSLGELGCALSHRSIYQKMINEDISEAIIFEDDVEFNDSLLQLLLCTNKFPKKAELILLGYWHVGTPTKNLISFRNRIKICETFSFVRFTKNMHGNYGYWINLSGAKKMTVHSHILTKPIDHYTGDDTFINLYGVYPPIITLSHKFDIVTELQKERKSLWKKYKNNERSERNDKYQSLKSVLATLKILSFIKFLKILLDNLIYKMMQVKNRIIQFYWQIKNKKDYI